MFCEISFKVHDNEEDTTTNDDDDDSSEDDFQEGNNALHQIPFYLDFCSEDTANAILNKYGRGTGTYFVIPTDKGDSVLLYIYTTQGFTKYEILLIPTRAGIEFRLLVDVCFQFFFFFFFFFGCGDTKNKKKQQNNG